jgi:hypothetical protein
MSEIAGLQMNSDRQCEEDLWTIGEDGIGVVNDQNRCWSHIHQSPEFARYQSNFTLRFEVRE